MKKKNVYNYIDTALFCRHGYQDLPLLCLLAGTVSTQCVTSTLTIIRQHICAAGHGRAALFAFKSVHIFKFSLKIIDGFAQIKRQKIFSLV
jgi:hypothetical protein